MSEEKQLNAKPKIIKFIGFSGSGKTTLIESIVKELTLKGLNVATVKLESVTATPDEKFNLFGLAES